MRVPWHDLQGVPNMYISGSAVLFVGIGDMSFIFPVTRSLRND